MKLLTAFQFNEGVTWTYFSVINLKTPFSIYCHFSCLFATTRRFKSKSVLPSHSPHFFINIVVSDHWSGATCCKSCTHLQVISICNLSSSDCVEDCTIFDEEGCTLVTLGIFQLAARALFLWKAAFYIQFSKAAFYIQFWKTAFYIQCKKLCKNLSYLPAGTVISFKSLCSHSSYLIFFLSTFWVISNISNIYIW